jgi:hypothetical protein
VGHPRIGAGCLLSGWAAKQGGHAAYAPTVRWTRRWQAFLAFDRSRRRTKNVWYCGSSSLTNQGLCSQLAASAATLTDADRRVFNIGNAFVGVGDTYASSNNHCARVRPGSGSGSLTCTNLNPCVPCPDATTEGTPGSGPDGVCDDFRSWAARVESNIVRYLWDIVDTNNEGNEATDESIVTLLSSMESMLCDGSSNSFGADGDCNGPNREDPARCVPATLVQSQPAFATGNAVSPMRRWRDAYNPLDFDEIGPSDQTGARAINCVNFATD